MELPEEIEERLIEADVDEEPEIDTAPVCQWGSWRPSGRRYRISSVCVELKGLDPSEVR